MRRVLFVLSMLVATAAVPADAPGRGDALECQVEPSVVANVGSPVDGVLEVVPVDRGDDVRKGQVVARLKAGVEAAAVDLSSAKVEFSRRKVARNEELFRKQLISTHDKDEMETELRVSEQEHKRDVENLKLRSILSPLNGVVVERRLSAGELVRAERSVVLKLAQVDPLYVEVVAPLPLFRSIRPGMTGLVSMEPLVDGVHKAKVVVVDRLIDAASGTFGVRLELPNPRHRIPAGIKCSIRFPK